MKDKDPYFQIAKESFQKLCFLTSEFVAEKIFTTYVFLNWIGFGIMFGKPESKQMLDYQDQAMWYCRVQKE